MAARLQRLDDLDLVLGGDAGEHRGFLDALRKLGDANPVEFGASQHHSFQAQFAGDGGGGDGVVAGDHLDLDAGLLAQANRVAGLGAGRIDDADQSDQSELLRPGQQVGGRVKLVCRDIAFGHRQHAHGLAGEIGILGLEVGADFVVERRRAVRREIAGGARQQYIGRAFRKHAHPPAVMVKCGHELVGGIERNFGDARALLGQTVRLQPALGGQRQQRSLGGVADQLAAADMAFVAQRDRHQQRQQIRLRQAIFGGNSALAGIALARGGKTPAAVEQPARGHLVEGQRAGLVGADHRGRAQGFHRRQFFDDRAILRHAVHADRQRYRHHCRQALGDGGHCQGNGGDDGLHQRVAAQNAEHENQRHHHAGDDGEALAQPVELHLQRGGGFLRCFQQAGDAPHLGFHAGGGDQRLDPAAGHHGVHEHHVAAFRQRIFAGRERVGVLAHGMGFAGQGRFRHLGVVRRQHTGVGGHAVTRLEQHDVAGHQFLGGDLPHLAAAPYPRMLRQHLLERRQGCVGAVLLVETEAGVEHDDDQNHHCVLDVADRTGQRGCADQHDHQQILELVEELQQSRARRLFLEPVGAKALQPQLCFGIG